MNRYLKQNFKNKFDKKKPLILFDRDGVITKKFKFLLNEKDVPIYKPVIEALRLLNYHGFPIIVITNQAVIARGWVTIRQVKAINEEMVLRLNSNNVFINGVYSCPHHPNADLSPFKMNCECRKPETLMIRDALEKYNVKKGYIIGDKTTDIKAGEKAGIKTILVKTGYRGRDKTFKVKPDFICKNALYAAKIIIKDFKNS